MTDRLFTPRFFVMCGFTFTVFLSAFQLLPAAPFRIRELGGSTLASGLFLGFLTFASAVSAPFTGAIADRIGRPRTLLIASLVIAACSVVYAVTSNYRLMLGLVVVHGVFWSGLLTASGAYMTNMLPARRRAEGIGYWGLASIGALAVAPPVAFWILRYGWAWLCASCVVLNLLMAAIAWTLREDDAADAPAHQSGAAIEWRVLVLSVTLFLYSFGYGAVTSFSAVFADALGITPKSLYLTTLAIVVLLTRPLSGTVGDRIGHKRVFLPCLVLIAIGLGILALHGTRGSLITSAVIFGVGFGTAYPMFIAYVMHDVDARRRGAAFGAVLAAFDTGVGSGSTVAGWLIQRFGFSAAFGTAAVLSAIALPYFLLVDRRLR